MRRISIRRQPAWVLAGLTLVALLAVGGFGLTITADAQTSFSVESIGGQVGLGDADLRQVVINVIRWVLGILTLTAVVYMMYGGYLWLTAAGNEKRVEKAKQVILQAAIGLVIVLLAWAIVFFVARSLANVTNQSNTNTGTGGGCNPLIEECGEVTTFDVTNIASCSVGDPNSNVPRSSAIQLTFNANLKDGAVEQGVADDLTNANPPNLIVQECASNDCTNPANLSTPVPLENQKFKTPPTPTTTGVPQADWTQNGKVVTFYHVATDTVAADARLFKPDQKYLLTIPAKSASKALLDLQDRTVQNCRRQTSDIAGLPGCNATGADRITWEFTTGADVDGPALSVVSGYPSFAYQTSDVSPNRSVARSSFLSIQYNTPIDFNTLTTDNFKVLKCTDTPTAANDWNECDDDIGNQVSASNFEIQPRPDGRGGILRPLPPFQFDGFTWYKVEVSNVRSLCGRVQEPPNKTWVFQTNDSAPGVKKVYPRDGYQNACPATKVFIQYATSMWDGSTFDCNVDSGSYVSRGLLTNNPGRNLRPMSVFDPDDPDTCTMYEFASTTTLLPPNTNFEARVESDLVIDSNGRKLNYGYNVTGGTSEGPWAFKTATAATCAQEPVITKISPGQGPDGQCLSVIGDYFEKVNVADENDDAPDPGDKLELRATSQPADTWTNEYIVTTVNAEVPPTAPLTSNSSHPYTVTVNYPVPIGPLTSMPENFYLTDDLPSLGPCLTKISPTAGPINTRVTAIGKRLGTGGEVHYSTKSPPQWTVGGPWTETRIDNINVDAGSPPGVGQVTVLPAAGGESNPLPFTVTTKTTTPGTVPAIEETTVCSATRSPSPNPKRDQLDACINAWPSARFTVEMNPASINTTTVILERCDTTPCTNVTGNVTLLPGNQVVRITPATSPLAPATAYRVRIDGVLSADQVPMAAPYEWRFTTKTGDAPCPIDRVMIQQSNRLFNKPFALGLPTEVMDSACNSVNGSGLTYAWSNTNDAVCALQPNYTGQNNVCTSPSPITEGVAVVQVSIPTENISSNTVTITADQVACTDSSQCACGGTASQCINSKCQPVVTGLTPDKGRVGTWTTIQGCWFGSYNSTTSKVIFTDNKEGITPTSASNACTAANTWSNTQIVREVPQLEEPTNDTTNDAVTGPVQVVRGDGLTANSPNPFTISADEYPKICRIDPSSSLPGGAVTVYGKDLGATQGSGDQAEITDQDTPAMTPFVSYPQWQADRIGAVVPIPTPLPPPANVFGVGNVRVTHLAKISNPIAMTLRDPAEVSSSCAVADRCVFGDDSVCGPGRGCGFNNCCADRPVVVKPTRPGLNETDVCRNTQVQVDFSQPLLSSTVNAATVKYYNGPNVVNGKISLINAGKTVAYEPGLLSPSLDQRMSLVAAAASPLTVVNQSFETADATGVPTGWGAVNGVKQSPEHPSGAGSFSALADCTIGGCAKAEITQDVDTPSPVVRSYRVTGWVKAEVNPGSLGGLVSQCSATPEAVVCTFDNRTKTFDRWGDAPGLFDNRNGTTVLKSDWKKVDFVVTNIVARNLGLRLNCFANSGAKIWCDDLIVTRLDNQSTLLRGTTGVLADVTLNKQFGTDPFNLTFTSSASVCALDRVIVTPSSMTLTASGQVGTVDAKAYSGRRAAPLAEVSGVYEWSWRWERVGGSDAIASVQNQDAPLTSVTAGTTVGKVAVKATAKVTVDANNDATINREAAGSANVTVDFCENPWIFTDGQNNCTTEQADCPDFHFRLYYCPKPNEPFFSHQAIEGQNHTDAEREKSFFFKESATSQDVIGMLVYANPELLSPYDWYLNHFSAASPGASEAVGGFPAIRTGTTAVVGVTDLTDGGSLQGYIFVIDFNSNSASSITKAIYTRLLNSIEFNATQSLSPEDQLAIATDTQRVQDLRSIKTLLEKYKTTNGRYPDLPAGSFITGFSTSAWPSWQRELANALGRTLPTDPTNGFTAGVCQAPYEAATCWAEPQKRFQCPAGSQIYAYKSTNGGTGYELFANLTYAGTGNFTNYSANPCSGLGTGNTCACFNYRLGS